MRVGIRDADRLKNSPSSAPVCALGHLPPCGGKALGAVQIGRDSALCGTFGYIYWELGRSAPVGGGRPSVPPLRRRRGKPGRRVREAVPYKRGGGGKPPPYGFPETVLKLGRGALVLPPETCAREASGRVRAPAPTPHLQTALHTERGTGLEPVP